MGIEATPLPRSSHLANPIAVSLETHNHLLLLNAAPLYTHLPKNNSLNDDHASSQAASIRITILPFFLHMGNLSGKFMDIMERII